MTTLEELEEQIVVLAKKLLKEEWTKLEKAKEEFARHQKLLDSASTLVSEWSGKKIVLNIGGSLFSTTYGTLMSTYSKGSFFEALVTHTQKDTEITEYFVDRDGTDFQHILTYLRVGSLNASSHEANNLLVEADFYQLEGLQKLLQPFLGSGLSAEHQMILYSWLPANSDWNLIYKASEHGFSSASFHHHCDNKGHTVVIIKSQEGHLFGGYAPFSWEPSKDKQGVHAPGAFVFTLKNPYGIAPTKFNHNGNAGHLQTAEAGPCFGSNGELRVANNPNEGMISTISNFPGNYFVDSLHSAAKEGKIFTGAYKFQVQELLVFSAC